MSNIDARKNSLEAQREVKRRQMESLFAQKQAIEDQMEALEKELNLLDDQIDQLEEEEDEDDVSSFFVKQEPIATQQQQPQDEDEDSQEMLTDPMTLTMHPDEVLTDVTSQTQQQQQRMHDDEEDDIEEFGPFLQRKSSSSIVGTLDLKPASKKKRSSSSRQPQASLEDQRGQIYHAEPPEALRRTTAAPSGTLDHYFAKPSAGPLSSSAARLDSLQSLPTTSDARPPPQDRGNAGIMPQQYQQQQQGQEYPWTQQVDHLLRRTFRLQQFRDNQREIINATLSGDDVFVLMRTGGGKSLTYQLPAVLEQNKITLVVSPLISLIRDQEDQMNAFRPNSATSFTSNIGREEHNRRWNMIRNPNSGVIMILVTPEKVHKSNKLKSELQKLHTQGRLGRFVIDECHCATQWGHDFRPDYTKLGALKYMFPTIPLLAVTATASRRVREDVVQILNMSPNYRFFRSSARRDNLAYQVRSKTNKVLDDMAEFIQTHHPSGAGIVYTFSRKEADTVAEQLCERGIVAESYHSAVSDSKKDAIHRSWMRNETQVVVATIAFGLGINKPDVRFVLHHSLSKSLEAYYQESGRAGRDGNPADCVLYYAPKDVSRMICMIHGESGEQIFWQMARYAQASGNDDVCKAIILSSLGEPGAANPQDVERANLGSTTEEQDVGKHAQTVTKLLQYKINCGEDLTIPQLVKEWRSKTAPDFVKENPPGKELSVDECERIVVMLIIEDILSPSVSWNAYTSNMYLKLGRLGRNLLASPSPVVQIRLPKRAPRKAAKKRTPKAATPSSADGWFERNEKPKAKRQRSSTDKSGKSKEKRKPVSNKAPGKKNDAKGTQEVIEVDLCSSSDEDENAAETANASRLERLETSAVARMPTPRAEDADSDSEAEFED